MGRAGCSGAGATTVKRQLTREVLASQASDLGRHGRMFNDDEVLVLLRAAVERKGNQVAFARHHGLERASLNMILNGKRPVSDKIIKALGLRKVYAASE